MSARKTIRRKRRLKSTPWAEQKFAGKGRPKAKRTAVYKRLRMQLRGEPAIKIAVLNGKLVVEKIVSRTWVKKGKRPGWPKEFRLLASNPKLAMHLAMSEVVIQNALIKKYNQLLKAGGFKRREVLRRGSDVRIRERNYFLRVPKIYGLKLSSSVAAENRIFMELINKPDFNSLFDFVKNGKSGKGKHVDSLCEKFVKDNKLDFQLRNKQGRERIVNWFENFFSQIYSDLSQVAEQVKLDRRTKHLDIGFGYDFIGQFGLIAENFLVERIDSKGILHFVLIDSLKASESIYGLPELSKEEIQQMKKMRIDV